MEGFLPADTTFATRACHVGQEPEQWTSMAVVPPISMSTTFKQDAPAEHRVSTGAGERERERGRERERVMEGEEEVCVIVVSRDGMEKLQTSGLIVGEVYIEHNVYEKCSLCEDVWSVRLVGSGSVD